MNKLQNSFTKMSLVFSWAAGAIVIGFFGVIIFGMYTCIQAPPSPPQTVEEECRDWALKQYQHCTENVYVELDGAEEVKAVERCQVSHSVTRLMHQCIGDEDGISDDVEKDLGS